MTTDRHQPLAEQRIDAPTWLTTTEVAVALGLTRAQVQRRVRQGTLPCLAFGYADPANRGGATFRFDAGALRGGREAAPPESWTQQPATAEQLAAWLRVDPKTLRRAVALGQLRSSRPVADVYRAHVFSRRAVLAFLVDYSTAA
jgi:hypothetical protein